MLEHSTTGLWTQKHRDSGNNFRVPKKVSVPGRSSFISFSFPPVISSRFCMSCTIWGNEKCLDRPLITCIMELCLRLLVVSLNKHHFIWERLGKKLFIQETRTDKSHVHYLCTKGWKPLQSVGSIGVFKNEREKLQWRLLNLIDIKSQKYLVNRFP